MLRVRLRRWIGRLKPRKRSDGELLLCFTASGEEGAFAALVTRHERTVLGVCQGVLRHQQDAEDACQKTFLVLMRKAAFICDKERIGSWLRGTAYRVAKNVRRSKRRRENHEQLCEKFEPAQPASKVEFEDLQTLINGEVQRLPENYRAPFVLCCLEGLSKKEAARRLGWNEGTLSSRLAKARKVVQGRLERQGITRPATRGAASDKKDGCGPHNGSKIHCDR